MYSFDEIGDIFDNIEYILAILFLIYCIYLCFLHGVDKYGKKGILVTFTFFGILIAFTFFMNMLTKGQDFVIQSIIYFVICLTWYYVLKFFFK